MKLVTSVLSLESELDIDVSAQNKFAISLLPKQTLLLPVVIAPEGALALPELCPHKQLLPPVVMSAPAERPIAELLEPVDNPDKAASPIEVLLLPVVQDCKAS